MPYKDPEEEKRCQQKYRLLNKKEIQSYQLKYRTEHKEYFKKKNKEFREKNPSYRGSKPRVRPSNLEDLIQYRRFYTTYRNMLNRCLDKNHKNYFRYGGRGITISDEWLQFKNFRRDMYNSYCLRIKELGNSRKLTSLDRINNDKGYSKENCRWATQKEQCENRRERDISTYSRNKNTNPNSIRQRCIKIGADYTLIRQRMGRGRLTFEQATTLPFRARIM